MTGKSNKKLLSLILSMMLIVAMAFSMTACGDKNTETPNTGIPDTGTEADAGSIDNSQDDANAQDDADTQVDVTVAGEGSTVFMFAVVDADGNEKAYEIHTDKTVVGDALIELDLIAGDAGDYGLYVKTVDGITVDYDEDGKYWAFYINGEYAMTGVDATLITEGEEYSFKVE